MNVLAILYIILLSASSMQCQKDEWTQGSTQPHSCKADIDCLPWTECNKTKCICKDELMNHYALRCDKDTLQLSVLRCHCVTFDNVTNQLIQGNCIENCEKNRYKSDYLPLPKDLSQLNQFMCEERWNRTGRLCGRCLPGHSPLAYSYDMRCVKCPERNRNIWKYILVAFGPLTVFYFLVLFFKINANSSHLHGYIIFSQIISIPAYSRGIVTYNHNHPESKVPIQIIELMYEIWNLDFFRILDLDICLDVSTLTVLALDYAVAIYPLLLTVVSYILIELHARNFRLVVILWRPFRHVFTLVRRNWESKTTVIDAYATFFVLSYSKFFFVSADLLIPVRAYSITNDNITWVLYNDATIEYFGNEHIPYAVPAITCSGLLIIATSFLLFYQLKCCQNALNCCKIKGRIIHALMDSFQGYYKNGTDGTRDYRWFAAVPLVGRVSLTLTYAMILDGNYSSFIVLIIIIIIVLTAAIQPYKKHLSKYAKIDITFWAFLAAFYTIGETTNFSSLKSILVLKISKALRVVVAIIPLVYMTCLTVYWILSRMRTMNTLISRIRAWRQGYMNTDNGLEEDLPDRVDNPDRYRLHNPTN